jgi:diguanylate cyclase (GGDEF)-like protein
VSKIGVRVLRALVQPASLPAVIALCAVLGTGILTDNLNRQLHEQDQRASVTGRLSLIRAQLEGRINGDIQLVRGLASAFATHPSISPSHFAALAAILTRENPELRELAAAPDMVVRMVYPYKPNKAAIGLDYLRNIEQRAAALQARDTGKVVLAGPLNLVQGGVGLIARFPVYVAAGPATAGAPGGRRFWGLLSAVFDVNQLYADSGLTAKNLPIDVAISGTDGRGALGDRFFGPGNMADRQPVTAIVNLPSGSWQLSAVPKGGWTSVPGNTWLLWLAVTVAGMVVVGPILMTGRLMNERQTHIKALRTREEDLERLSRRLELALDTSRVGVWEYDIEADTLVWDDRMNELYGLPTDHGERGYADWRNALHPDDLEPAVAAFEEAMASRGRYKSEFRIVLPGGEVRTIRAIGSVYAIDVNHHKITGVNWDVSADMALNEDLRRAKSTAEARNAELEAAKARIEFDSLHDALTGLPNRRFLDEVLAGRHSLANGGNPNALLHIDLDRFKQINDTLGHAAGDAMLVHASRVLKADMREGDFVARIGGDEFVVVCNRPCTEAELSALAERIISRMRQPVDYEGHECRFGVSIGIASIAESDTDPRRLLVNADIALYRAKNRGRNRHEFFTQVLQAEIVRIKQTADDILAGIEHNEFFPFFQPQFDAQTWDVVGVEALARWSHPTEGLLGPDRFLRIAEELNVVAAIDRIILEKTLVQLAAWDAAGLHVPKASVNVSSRRLHDEDLIGSLSSLKIEPGRIAFELVESIFLDESAEIVAFNVDRITDLGIDIEIDDFGTGYASILSLLRLKPRRLKIDRQLVCPIVGSPGQRRLVESIVDIGKSLGIGVIAEGVETFEHARALRDIGCDALQGYAFAHPMNGDDLVAFTGAARWRGAS